jgi:hypothetical protein
VSKHLFAVVVIIVDNDNDISAFMVVSSGLNEILGWQFYLISALNLFVSHVLSCGSHWHVASES